MMPVPAAINNMVRVSAALRPARSPKLPMSTAPKGRTTNPSPNTKKVCSRRVVESWLGKKFPAM